jgi:hypothetical protein
MTEVFHLYDPADNEYSRVYLKKKKKKKKPLEQRTNLESAISPVLIR